MQLTINGHPQHSDARTVHELVQNMQLDRPGVAVELNRQVIPRNQFHDTPLHEGDQIEIVSLVGGG